MLRKVTLKPFTSAPNVSLTSRMIDAINYESSKRVLGEQIWLRNFPRCISLGQCLNDLLPVEAPVFNEYLAGVPAADDHPRQVDSPHIALQRIVIQRRPAALRIELHPEALDQRKFRFISADLAYLL